MKNPNFVIAGVLAVLLAGVAFAGEDTGIADDYEAKDDNWRFILSPYALLANQATDVGGEKLRQSFNDLSSMTNFGFQLITNVVYKKWIFTADGTYANLGSKSGDGILQTELDIKQYILDLRLGYLVHSDVDLDDDSGVVRGWALEVNAGAKYWQNDVSLDYSLAVGDFPPMAEGTVGVKQYWWDPMVGLKARVILSRTVMLGITASGGGFGIGDASEYSWDWVYTNTFKVSKLISVTAGFRSFKYKRVEGEAGSELETRVQVQGPLIGVSFVF